MEFNDEMESYTLEYDGIVFEWEEEPQADVESDVKAIVENYQNELSNIIAFMLPDIIEIYGNVTAEDVKVKLGKPIINIDRGEVVYCEQAFDDLHIFGFEFFGNDFKELDNFMIDG